jgi:hypothetical protein
VLPTCPVAEPTIQIELTYAPMHQSPVTLPVSSFMAEAHGRPPEGGTNTVRQRHGNGSREAGGAHPPHRSPCEVGRLR